jgi:hypothetical protein
LVAPITMLAPLPGLGPVGGLGPAAELTEVELFPGFSTDDQGWESIAKDRRKVALQTEGMSVCARKWWMV